MKRYFPFAIILAVLVLAVAGGAIFFRHLNQPPLLPPKSALGKPGAEPPHLRGATSAPVMLEEFGDFECLPCSVLYPILKKAETDYGKRLCVIFRQYPLSQHRHAPDASRAAEAAGLQNRFWEMHDLLYENRLAWLAAADTRAALELYAARLNLDLERFKKDMESEAVSARLAADNERRVSLALDRTPTIFVNNERITTRPITIEILHAAIDAAIAKKSK